MSRRDFFALRNGVPHATLVRFDLSEMEGNVPAELLEKWYPVSDQDGQDRITNVVSQSTTKTVGGNDPPPKPDAAEGTPQSLIYELREIS